MRAVKCVTGTYGVILEDDRECNAATRPRDSQVSQTNAFQANNCLFFCLNKPNYINVASLPFAVGAFGEVSPSSLEAGNIILKLSVHTVYFKSG